jgi:hypothetical protein
MGADGGYKLQGLLDIVGLDELKAIKSNPKQELLSFFFHLISKKITLSSICKPCTKINQNKF